MNTFKNAHNAMLTDHSRSAFNRESISFFHIKSTYSNGLHTILVDVMNSLLSLLRWVYFLCELRNNKKKTRIKMTNDKRKTKAKCNYAITKCVNSISNMRWRSCHTPQSLNISSYSNVHESCFHFYLSHFRHIYFCAKKIMQIILEIISAKFLFTEEYYFI